MVSEYRSPKLDAASPCSEERRADNCIEPFVQLKR